MVARALQECPNSGLLWVLAIELEPKHQKKAKALDALNKCDHDPNIMIAIAKIFIEEKMIEKARKWFEKASKINTDLGDAWAYYYKMEMTYGNDVHQSLIFRIELKKLLRKLFHIIHVMVIFGVAFLKKQRIGN